MPLRPSEFYKDQSIDLELRSDVTGIDAKGRQVTLASGRSIPFDKLLLATGAEPVHLDIAGADQSHVHVLRSLADSQAIIGTAKAARRAVVIGASLIGLEVAAALRAREIEVHVVAPERRPLERVLGNLCRRRHVRQDGHPDPRCPCGRRRHRLCRPHRARRSPWPRCRGGDAASSPGRGSAADARRGTRSEHSLVRRVPLPRRARRWGQVNGYYVHVGSERFMRQRNIGVGAAAVDRTALDLNGYSSLYIAADVRRRI